MMNDERKNPALKKSKNDDAPYQPSNLDTILRLSLAAGRL